MSKKIKFENWNGSIVELDRDAYIDRVIGAANPGLNVLLFDNPEEIRDIKDRIIDMAGKKFDELLEREAA